MAADNFLLLLGCALFCSSLHAQFLPSVFSPKRVSPTERDIKQGDSNEKITEAVSIFLPKMFS